MKEVGGGRENRIESIKKGKERGRRREGKREKKRGKIERRNVVEDEEEGRVEWREGRK